MSTSDGLIAAAQNLALLGWPVMPVKPRGKEPLTQHGVKDATTTERTILHWFERWPDANLAIATGTPGPTVLDVDNPQLAGPLLATLHRLDPPTVATARGEHLYFHGLEQGTISLDYGELRGQGSYIIVPPSVHPSGKQYVWTNAPHGPLPPVPEQLTAQRTTAGAGTWETPTQRVPHGQRHDFLKDIAVRAVRSGITDVPTLILILQSAYETHCTKRPKAKPDEFRKLAEWAAKTDIAQRERQFDPALEQQEEAGGKKKKGKKTGLEKPPRGDAPLAEHRAYLRQAGGWTNRIDIKTVRRHGIGSTDRLDIELTNGQRIVFPRQDQITTRGHWARTVVMCTNGIADPISLTDWEQVRILRSLCILADTPPEEREREDLQDVLDDFLALAEAITDHDLSTSEGRFETTVRCRARGSWDPRDRDDEGRPVVIISRHDQRSYIRASELQNYLNWRGLKITTGALPGRMRMLDADHLILNGREQARDDKPRRRTSRLPLYRLAAEETG